jgi:hypothetical protein
MFRRNVDNLLEDYTTSDPGSYYSSNYHVIDYKRVWIDDRIYWTL